MTIKPFTLLYDFTTGKKSSSVPILLKEAAADIHIAYQDAFQKASLSDPQHDQKLLADLKAVHVWAQALTLQEPKKRHPKK